MSIPSQLTSESFLKNLEKIFHKSISICPFEIITSTGTLDTNVLSEVSADITFSLYKVKDSSGNIIEPTFEQINATKKIEDLNLLPENLIGSFTDNYTFKYNKNTSTRTIEQSPLPEDKLILDENYFDFGLDTDNIDFASFGGIFMIAKIAKTYYVPDNYPLSEEESSYYFFMIPSSECQELLVDFDPLATTNKTINLKKFGLIIPSTLLVDLAAVVPSIPTLKLEKDYYPINSWQNQNLSDNYFLFDNNANDVIGNLSSTPSNLLYSKFGDLGAITFNGTNTSTLTLPTYTPWAFTINTTISFWIKFSDITKYSNIICENTNDNLFISYLDFASKKMLFRTPNLGYQTIPDIISQDTWYNLTFIFNATTKQYQIYLNGIKKIDVIAGNSTGAGIIFGIDGWNRNGGLNGSISNLQIFNRILTQSEITSIYEVSSNFDTKFLNVKTKKDFFGDSANISNYIFRDNVNDLNGKFNGTISGTVSYISGGKFNSGISTSAAAGCVNLGNIHGTSIITSISAWIKWDGVSNAVIFQMGTSTSTNAGAYYFLANASKKAFGFSNGGGTNCYGFDATLYMNTWVHIVVVFKTGAFGDVYVNGVKQTLTNILGTLSPSLFTTASKPILLSFYGLGTWSQFGSWAQVRVFNRIISQSEALALYNENPSKEDKYYLTEDIKILALNKNSFDRFTTEFGQGPMIKFNGVDSWYTVPANTNLDFGTGDITAEFYFKSNNYSVDTAERRIFGFGTAGTPNFGIAIDSTTGKIGIKNPSSAYRCLSTFNVCDGKLHHIAFVKTNGTITIFIDGILNNSTTDTINYNAGATYELKIGFYNNATGRFNGSLNQLNVIKGYAKYTSNFTPEKNIVPHENSILFLKANYVSASNPDMWSKLSFKEKYNINEQVITPPTIKYNDSEIVLVKDKEENITNTAIFNDTSLKVEYLFNNNADDTKKLYTNTPTNILYETGKFGQAGIFNGSTSKIQTNFGINSSDFTVSFWAKVNNVQPTYSFFIGNKNVGGSTASDYYNGILTNYNNNNIPNIRINGVTYSFTAKADLSPYFDIFTHFVFTCSNKKLSLYLNNILIETIDFPVVFNLTEAIIGSASNGYVYSGSMDSLRIYDRGMIATEVSQLFNEKNLEKIVTYKDLILPKIDNLTISTAPESKFSDYTLYTGESSQKQKYRFYPVLKMGDAPIRDKIYLNSKYQRNIMEILSYSINRKDPVFNLKDGYLFNLLGIQTLNKINSILSADNMFKLTERLYPLNIKEKVNSELILEYLVPFNATLKTSLLTDYHFSQEEVDNLDQLLNDSVKSISLDKYDFKITGDKFSFKLPAKLNSLNTRIRESRNYLLFIGNHTKMNSINTIPGYASIKSILQFRKEVIDYQSTLYPTLSAAFQNTLQTYNGQLPIYYFDISNNIQDINTKPVFDNLSNISGFGGSNIVIDATPIY